MSDAPVRTPVYLDHAATTPVAPEVAALMARHLGADGVYANPASATHAPGRAAQRAVDEARREVALTIGARADEVVWTSGATEANNLALKGVARALGNAGHVVTCRSEHAAVLDVCDALERDGLEVTRLAPLADGRLEPGAVAAALRPDTVLVSVMHVNNETGVIQDIETIGRTTRARGIALHVDAAQSVGRVPLDVARQQVDLMSLSAHKAYGPKGVGALYVRRELRGRLAPLVHGGGQEGGLRAGTVPTHQVAGMGEAFRLARERQAADGRRTRALRERLWTGLAALGAQANGTLDGSVGAVLNVSFRGIAGEDLVGELDQVAVSTGSACASGRGEPSHVLRAMGCDDERADGAIRFSLGRATGEAEIDFALEAVRAALARLGG